MSQTPEMPSEPPVDPSHTPWVVPESGNQSAQLHYDAYGPVHPGIGNPWAPPEAAAGQYQAEPSASDDQASAKVPGKSGFDVLFDDLMGRELPDWGDGRRDEGKQAVEPTTPANPEQQHEQEVLDNARSLGGIVMSRVAGFKQWWAEAPRRRDEISRARMWQAQAGHPQVAGELERPGGEEHRLDPKRRYSNKEIVRRHNAWKRWRNFDGQ